ncbi:hypothetical protein H920_10050 [Fukomys damarensis]|uniref:Uncharacterized protein n=1 Tax=Fukomys damarensis TaxID=885580 RepID=A0A091DE05_FUKDA|nr:hypothetical protein H920_10050 [Fukomys damarensis]
MRNTPKFGDITCHEYKMPLPKKWELKEQRLSLYHVPNGAVSDSICDLQTPTATEVHTTSCTGFCNRVHKTLSQPWVHPGTEEPMISFMLPSHTLALLLLTSVLNTTPQRSGQRLLGGSVCPWNEVEISPPGNLSNPLPPGSLGNQTLRAVPQRLIAVAANDPSRLMLSLSLCPAPCFHEGLKSESRSGEPYAFHIISSNLTPWVEKRSPFPHTNEKNRLSHGV